MANMDQFEAYFKRADLDGDGRISGAEAVAFFQGSGLDKQVLAQIWNYADQSRSSFLSRQEFYNALRLVTVAQSKRDLTPEIVKAALHSPAASKIPAPKINLPATPGQQPSPLPASSQPGAVSATASQNFGLRVPGAQNASINQNYFPSQQNMLMRPTVSAPPPLMGSVGPQYRSQALPNQFQGASAGTPSHLPQSLSAATMSHSGGNSNISNAWFGGKTPGAATGVGVVGQTPSAVTKPQSQIPISSQPGPDDSKALVLAGNGSSSESRLGGGRFPATSSQQNLSSSVPGYSENSTATSSAVVPASSAAQSSSKTNALDSLQSAFSMLPAGNHLQQSKPPVSSGQPTLVQGSVSPASSGNSVGGGNPIPPSSQLPWPKMKPSDIQKYSKVFTEVDTDRDGKITGEQARNLFLSWRLPREVLKHVWDLADQDNDTMLSLREFCFALYLMERYREGRPLPTTLPRNVMFDDTLLSMTGPSTATYGNVGWSPGPGLGQQGMVPRPVSSATGMRPPVLMPAHHPDGGITSNQQKAGQQGLDDPFASQLGDGEQSSLSSTFHETASEEEKVDEKERVILDSKEKIEFYRTKMQDFVLYKSRCDNRLNEILERASADKREAEMLGKKYEEKYKQVAEIASKLTIEEARFREVQERKSELHQAIVHMEQGGSVDGILQVRADRIQSDLEELLKALAERSKRHGLDVKSKALIELPFGWQPGIQEGAALWDEDWDKFEDEGFSNELTFDGGKHKSPPPDQQENGFHDGGLSPDSSSHPGEKSGPFLRTADRSLESESAYGPSEDESSSALDITSPEHSGLHHGKVSETDAQTQRIFDDSNWGAFDANDDADSVWGFDASKSKESDLFGSGDFGVNPVRTGSPSSESSFPRKSPFVFDDSVPSTPMSRFGNSPPRFSNASRDNFDSFSRFDSFNVADSGILAQPDRLTRFDSMSSSRDFGGITRFDSMNSTRDFGGGERFSRFDSVNSSRDFGGATIARFDSMNSTKDFGDSHGLTFDDSDPFGSSGPFKVERESKSPKKGSDSWNAF